MLKTIAALALSVFGLGGMAAGADPSGTGGARSEDQVEMTIRKTVREVRVEFQVSTQNGQPIPNLQQGQFAVYEDERKMNTVTGFYAEQDLPLRVLMMIDASDSMSKGFSSERDAASEFLERIVRPGVDRSAVIVFSTQSEVELRDQSSGPEALKRIGMLRSAGLTALYDAICKVVEALPGGDAGQPLARRVLVLLSDGNDTYSLHSLNDAIAAAQKSELVIYAIAAHKPSEYRAGDANLKKLAEATGGRVFLMKKYEQSEKVFVELEQEIRSQYTVTFRVPDQACGYHSTRIELSDRSLRVRARAGFYGDCF